MAEDNRKWWILLTVIVGTFLGAMDQTVVNLAVPKIMLDFNILTADAAWIATAYILANAVFVPVWGKLGDTIGRKKCTSGVFPSSLSAQSSPALPGISAR